MLQRKARLVRGRYFVIKILSGDAAVTRFGVVIGVSVDKRSSRRNAIKRAVYDALRPYIAALPPKDVVVTVQSPASTATKEELIAELHALLA